MPTDIKTRPTKAAPSRERGARRPPAEAASAVAESAPAPAERAPAVPDGLAREARVREAAYYLYENSGRQPGRELDHWLAAEAEVAAGAPAAPRKRSRGAKAKTAGRP